MIDLATAVNMGQNRSGVVVTPDGTVQSEVPCRRCGYNLRGLNVGGACPECGAPVGFSVKGDLLEFSSPEWLATLASGARLFVWTVVLVILGAIVAAIGSAAMGGGNVPFLVIGLLSTVMFTLAWWQMTEPDPSGLGEDRYGTARKLIRIGLLAGIVESGMEFANLSGPYPPVTAAALGAVGFAANVMNLIAFFAGLNYLRKLALRIPDDRLAGRARFLIWAFAVSMTVLIVGVIAFIIMIAASRSQGGTAAPPQGLAVLATIGGVALGIAMIVFGIMYLLLLVRMGGAFKSVAIRARANLIQQKHAAALPPVSMRA